MQIFKGGFHVFLQPSFTFSYYGRVGSQRHRMRRTAPSHPQPMITSRSLNDLRDLPRRLDRRELQLSASTLSSDSSISEGGADRGATVRLLWLSMMRVKWNKDTKNDCFDGCLFLLLLLFSADAKAVMATVSVSPPHLVFNYSGSFIL